MLDNRPGDETPGSYWAEDRDKVCMADDRCILGRPVGPVHHDGGADERNNKCGKEYKRIFWDIKNTFR